MKLDSSKVRPCSLALLAAITLTPFTAFAQDDDEPEEAPVAASGKGDPAPGSARAALRSAGDLAAKVKGLRGASRAEAQQRAVDAYRAAAATFASDKAACAEAWFEIGELTRRLSHLAEAEEAYVKADALDHDRYGERALLQLAHVQRRLERVDEALATYRKVTEIKPTSARAHSARVWIARCLQGKGDLDGATTALEQALGTTTDPQRTIELCNGLAQVCLARGDLDGASVALTRADQVVPADGPQAAKLRRAAEDMSARRALQRLRDKAAGAAEDARKLEAETQGKVGPSPNGKG